MMRGDIHAAVQIKTVRGESLHTGIEREVFAFIFPGVFDQPVEERGAVTAGAFPFVGDKIVEIKSATREKEIQDAKTRDGTNDPVQLEKGKLISLLLLVENARSEIDGFDVRTQFAHDVGTAADLFGCASEADFPQGRFGFRHGISSPAAPRDQAGCSGGL